MDKIFVIYMIGILYMSSVQGEILIHFSLDDNSGQLTFVGQVAEESNIQDFIPAQDINSLQFAILKNVENSNGDNYFIIDSKSGVLRTNIAIDRDVICPQLSNCVLSIKVYVDSSISSNPFSEFINVDITLEDANDNSPQFSDEMFSKSVPENTPVSSSISLPPAIDLDSPAYGIDYYSLTILSSTWSLKQVNNSGGIILYLVVEEELDREDKDFYMLQMTAYDKGGETGILQIEISILDINDHQPEFSQPVYEVSIDEDVQVGTMVATVKANDNDIGANSQIIYSFDSITINNYGKIFEINNRTGEIKLTANLNYEERTSYRLLVTAQEEFHETIPAEAQVLLNVNDINDNEPVILISSLSSSGNAAVEENSPVGTFVALLEVSDPDSGRGGQFTCKLQQNQNTAFHLDSINPERTEFKVSTNSIFNREDKDQYILVFECKDEGTPQLKSSEEIIVSILDQNDNPPIFTQLVYNVEVLENNLRGVYLTQVVANDADFGVNGEVEYLLSAEAMAYIKVDPQSGNITANTIFDYERYKSLQFAVIAQDKGEEKHQKTAVLNIIIINENDEPPFFTTSHFHFRMNESSRPLENIGQLAIRDRDPFNNVKFGFKEGTTHQDLFSIDPFTGVIYAEKSFDADDNVQNYFEFEVNVKDVDIPALETTGLVSVTVADLNDNRPLLYFPETKNNTVAIASDFQKGQVILTLLANDNDSGINADVTYSIESGNEERYFVLEKHTGRLRTQQSLKHIHERYFHLLISARDGGVPSLFDNQTLTVIVNQSLSIEEHGASSTLASTDNMTIVIVVAVISAVLIIILIVSIIILQRKDNFIFRQKQKRIKKLLFNQKPPVDNNLVFSGSGYIDKSDSCNTSYQQGHTDVRDYQLQETYSEEECGSQLSGADSGHGSNEDQDQHTVHTGAQERRPLPMSRRDMLLYGQPSTPVHTKQSSCYPIFPLHYADSSDRFLTNNQLSSHIARNSQKVHNLQSQMNANKKQNLNTLKSDSFGIGPSASYI